MHYPFLLGAAIVLSGVSPNRFVLSQANRTAPNQKPRLDNMQPYCFTGAKRGFCRGQCRWAAPVSDSLLRKHVAL